MTVRNQDNQAIFEGTVVLTRGPLVVNSDKMIVFFRAQSSDGSQVKGAGQPKDNASMSSASSRSLEKVEAIGHVKIKQENSRATCQKAIYFNNEEKIIMTGDPVAWEKGTRVSGKQITIYLTEERSVVEGDTHVRIEEEEQPAP
jgi:lipopolysaccharide export system protein LptA